MPSLWSCRAHGCQLPFAEVDPESEIHMVVDTAIEEVNIFEEDGVESEPDDAAMFDSGAASVIIGTQQLRRLMKSLLMKGCDVAAIPAWKCEKGLRFGNGNRDVTTLCVLVPTYFKNKRRDILMYVMEGSTPCLLGRPASPLNNYSMVRVTPRNNFPGIISKKLTWNSLL